MRRVPSAGLALTAVLVAGLVAGCNDSPTEVPTRDTTPPIALGTGSTVSGAVITTDKEDYAPGETVVITGTGWVADETVMIELTEDPQTHEAVSWVVQVDNAGEFVDATFIPQDHDLGVTFTLTATGEVSGIAQTTFTDGTLNLSITGLTSANNSFSPGTVTLDAQVSGTNSTANAETNVRVAIRAGSLATGTKVWEYTYNSGTIQQSGNYNASTTWDGKDNQSNPGIDVAEGEYRARLYSNGQTEATASANRIKSIVVDRTAPAVSGLTLTPNSTTGGMPVGASATAADAFTQVDQVNWELRNSASVVVLSGAMTRDGGSNGDKTWDVSTTFTAPSSPGSYKFCVYPQDKAGNVPASFASLPAANCATLSITSANQKPVAVAGSYAVQYEGAEITLDGSGSYDPDGDAITSYQWSIVSFTPPASKTGQCSFKNNVSTGVSPIVICNDNGSLVVGLTVSDGTDDSDEAQATIMVNNVAPTITTLSVSPALITVGSSVTASGSYTDPGSNDTHTASVSWDDGSGPSTPAAASGNVSAVQHTYTSTGIYEVKLTVTDDDGDSDEEAFQYVVVYDPSAGFVTGGGWISSPVGAYALDPTLLGKATFGFVSKYLKGASTPTGNTEFQFHAASMNFSSYSYEWLVVQGTNRATYKGEGTINGQGQYGFLLFAYDGGTAAGGDKFRIKIWEKSTKTVVYDNQMGSADNADPSTGTALGGGSIVIQTGKK